MEKLERSEFFKLVLLSLFVLLFTPLVSAWMKPSVLFLLLNLLILALGAESGAFTRFRKKPQEEKTSTTIVFSHKEIKKDEKLTNSIVSLGENESRDSGAKLVEKQTAGDNFVNVVRVTSKVKKCPSTPSLFFIGVPIDQKDEEEEEEEEEEIDEADELSAQELFAKAESFIGNFYKQLKMQREDSWRNIHGVYHRAI